MFLLVHHLSTEHLPREPQQPSQELPFRFEKFPFFRFHMKIDPIQIRQVEDDPFAQQVVHQTARYRVKMNDTVLNTCFTRSTVFRVKIPRTSY